MADRRREEWTRPPGDIRLTAVTGAVWYALVERLDPPRLVGAVWAAARPQIPRAGIVLAAGVYDGNFQDDLGTLTLTLRQSADLDPVEFLAHLAATRTGLDGKVSVGDAQQVASLDVVREAVGWPTI